jgi:hypothetical protein
MDFFNSYKDVDINEDAVKKNVETDFIDTKNEYKEFNMEISDDDDNGDVESNVESNVENNVDNMNDDRTGLIYDIMHILDDIYVYGRSFIENNYFNLSENDDFNLVYPNIYIGNYSTSTNQQLLKDLGITHIISVIPSFNPPFLDKFKYLHIEAYDDESQDMTQHFENSNEFISNCLNEGGKILIHCMVGKSRSITLFLAFLIYIIQGHFHKKDLNLEDCNDIYNSIEYNKFIKDKKLEKKLDNKMADRYDGLNTQKQNHLYDIINTTEHIKPQFSNKEKNFILYKKEKMLNDVDELIKMYSLLKKEITVFKKSNDDTYKNIDELNNVIKNMKKQSAHHFIIQLLKYVKTYRQNANPNPYFITQLCEYIF